MPDRDVKAQMAQPVLNTDTERVQADLAVPRPVVTVVVVNWNSGTMLRACLTAAMRKSGNLEVKVVVVDNHSRDGSAELVAREFPGVLLIRAGRNLGFGRGNNLAQAHARPGYVLFLNPDTELRANALERMVGFLAAHPETGAVGCKMVFPDGGVADQNLQWFPNPLSEFVTQAFLTYRMTRRLEGLLPLNDPLNSGYVKKLYGGCFMVRTAVLERVGWFDERFFMYAEDVDLSRRIREADWKLYYLSEAEIMHVAGGTTRNVSSDFSILMACESMEKLIEKYQGVPAAIFYRIGLFGASLLRLCFLSVLILLSPALPAGKRGSSREAVRNCMLRVKWVLGLRPVFIPE
jgi:N-acetylglucosaminyl-diphospho-decaprenol L-rhamnosyltransferase